MNYMKKKMKIHCILCDRKDPFMWFIRLPRNDIQVPICTKCADKYELWRKETNSLGDILKPVMLEAIHEVSKEEGR